MVKKGDKYIIEIGEVINHEGKSLYLIKGFNALVFDDFGLEHLTRWIEPLDPGCKCSEETLLKLVRVWSKAIGEVE